ncbi:MAG TPA: LuxR C-terminal-related transcriptional regulator [Pseudonocardia sp.]|jgi:DNA-binding CsgD family transcriptional regulator/GAF domain-containing protein|nr:LuxR C-terminal-related transcriptional regulator [Pseudonocardia sp.]
MPGAAWSITGVRLSNGRQEQVLDAVTRAAGLLGWQSPPSGPEVADQQGALRVLATAWRGVSEALSTWRAGAEGLAAMVDALAAIRAAEDGVRDDQSARQAGASQVVRDALGGLRDVRTVEELVERAPSAASMVGFDRVLLSRIDESTWVPETMYVSNDARWADEIVAAGREDLRTLDNSILETQIVRRNRPLVVSETLDHPNLHRAMIDAAQVRSYAAAPISAWGRVIGFLHADCYQQRRHLDGTDRDLLWMFCDGLGHLITRTAAIDAVQSLRGELDRLAAGVRSFESDGGWPSARPGSGPAQAPRPAAPRWFPDSGPEFADDVEGALTRREVEVMRLMGAGHTNAQIARRLVISEGTVKSHVKHILRKLQASNRAEAVSRWLREEHARHARNGLRDQSARVGA